MRCVVNVAMLLMTLRLTPCDVTKSYLVLRELPSVKGACDAQCEAYCQEIPDHVDECESLCRPGIPRKWIFNCQHGGDCKATGYCSVLAKQSLTGSYVPSKPVLKILRDPSTKGILLHWEEDKQTVHRVIYIVQWALNVTSVPTEDMWFTLGWTIRGSYMINDIKDACIDPWFRVAAVSRFGSRWYSKAMQTPPLDVALYPPGPVQDISVNHFTYHKDTDEITFQLFWKEPAGWERNDIISYQWTEHLDHPCLDSGQGVPIIPDARSSSNDTHVQSFRMPNIGVGCKFKFKIVAYARCNPNLVGQYNSIDVTVDCHTVKELPCPAHIYNPPGNVQNITLVVIPSVRGSQVLVCWDPPADMGSEGRVDQYHIKWGRVLYDEMLDMATLYNTSTKTVRWNVTCTTIRMGNTTTNNSDPYGVQIIASSPGHGVDSWLSPVQKVPPTDQYPSQSDWTEAHRSSSFTTVLKDSNGVVIVLVPKAKGVRLYVTKPEERSRDSLSGFFIHWGRVLNESNKLSLQDKASIFMPKNDTSVLLMHLQAERQYGVKVFPYCNITDGYEVDDAEPDPEPELQVFTMPLIEELRHPEEKKESLNTDAVTSITVAMSVAIIILVVVFVYSKKRRKKLSFLEQRYQRDNHGHANYYDLNGHNRPDFSSLTSPPVVADVWELPHSCLKLGQVLGTGAFGMVMEGQVSYAMLRHREVQVPLKDRKGRLLVTVAVKMLQEGVDSRYYRDFIQEINLMKKIGYHVNVVSMFGCCTLREPICLVVEHMPLGDLLHYLKKIRHILITQEDSMGHYQNREAEHLTPLDLLSFARQIVRGMEFLSGKSFVHRDLAARNILVDENKVLKIGDFGLTRYIYDDKVYVNRRGGKLPIKWMSVEAIFELTFSTASDVWSYGILLFELMTLGGSPYPGISNQELLLKLRNGYRMECPDNCAVEIYQLMRDCWKTNPKERPSFTDIRKRIDVMITECSGQEYLDLQLDESQDYYQVETSEDDDSVLELNMDAQANDDAGERGTVVEETSLTEESPSVVVRQRSTDKVLVTTHKKIHPGSTDEEFKLSVASYKGGKHERFAAGCSSQECSLERTQSGRLPCCNPENNSQSTLERGKSENIPRKITSDVNRKPGSPDPVEGLGRLQKRCQRGYQRYLKHRNGQADAAENHEGQTAEMDNRDRESDSSYSQLDGSDDVFSDGLYTMPYSYLQRPSDLEGLPSTDSSPTESDLSDGFFQAGSLSIIYGPKRLRMASEVSTTSIDSGLPQSPTQTDFSPRSSPQYISRYTKHQSITGQARKTKLRRLTRITSTEPTLPSVVNSDEDITSSSL